ncbi:MAG: low molecular weight phosphatase family protein [Ilumatobacter sp.]
MTTPPADDVLKILTVCTHNRTRSVMSMAMLQDGLDRRLGAGRAVVRSLGFGPEDERAIDDAVDAMRRRSLDVTEHRSRKVSALRVDPADLILTAERDHVVKIASESQAAYRRSFTLPEFLQRVASDPVADGRSISAWANDLSAGRLASDYLQSDDLDVFDPTGSSRRRFARSVDEISAMCDQVVELLARSFDDPEDDFEF